MKELVGEMVLVNCSGDKNAPGEEYWAIAIFQVHPGYDEYDSQPPELRNLMMLTWMLALRVGAILLALLEQGRSKEETRLQLLKVALQESRVRWDLQEAQAPHRASQAGVPAGPAAAKGKETSQAQAACHFAVPVRHTF